MISFFPRVVKFFDLFNQQNELLVESAQLLSEVFHDISGMSEKCARISKNEQSGNEVTREIARSLALTFITPIDREDIYSINVAQENALNAIRAVSTRIGLYHFDTFKPGAVELTHQLHLMHGEISQMVGALKTRKPVGENTRKVKQLKTDADMLLLVSLGEVFESQAESHGDLLETVKWSHIYDRLEEAVATAELLANVIEGVSLKNA